MEEVVVAIGGIKHTINCKSEEKEAIQAISLRINRRLNELSLDIGRSNDSLTFILLLLINANRLHKASAKFEKLAIEFFREISHFFDNKNPLNDNLVVSSIVMQNKMDSKGIMDDEILAEESTDESMDEEFLDSLIKSIEAIANNIKQL